ncbi:MAG: DNA/RNA non-specific endonuclease [Campylobacterales bacterium]|nr:DNA/RNA non-specific endonuclease [Campylobacterales bacterium]
MKKHLLLILTALSLYAGSTLCPSHYLEGIVPDIQNQKLSSKAREVCYDDYGVMHSGITKTPLWSAEFLTANSNKIKRKDAFHTEDKLPFGERSELSDYVRSGYDRGHMTPSADATSEKGQYETFSLANIVPQDSYLNQNLWSSIESATRYLASKDKGIFVITGPLFIGKSLKAIGHNKVLVPTHVYKIVYSPKQHKGAVFVCNNASVNTYSVITIAELEKISGINFFPKLGNQQKSDLLDLPKVLKRGSKEEYQKTGLGI